MFGFLDTRREASCPEDSAKILYAMDPASKKIPDQSKVIPFRPKLIVNRSFMREFIDANPALLVQRDANGLGFVAQDKTQELAGLGQSFVHGMRCPFRNLRNS